MARKSSAQQQRKYWYNVYKKVLTAHDVKIKDVKRITKATINSMKKKYTKLSKEAGLEGIRKEYRALVAEEERQADWRDQERTEGLRTVETPMIDINRQIIDDFIYLIEQIYDDTLRYIESRSDKTSDIAYQKKDTIIPKLTDNKEKIVSLVNEMEQTMNDPFRVATLIKENVDLDYTIAISIVPPSDINIEHFDITLAQLQAIWDKVIAGAIEQAERELGY